MYLHRGEINWHFQIQNCILKVCIVSALLMLYLLQFFFCAFVSLLLLSSAREFFFRQIVLVPKNAVELMILRPKKSPIPLLRITKVSVVQIPQCSESILNIIWRKKIRSPCGGLLEFAAFHHPARPLNKDVSSHFLYFSFRAEHFAEMKLIWI